MFETEDIKMYTKVLIGLAIKELYGQLKKLSKRKWFPKKIGLTRRPALTKKPPFAYVEGKNDPLCLPCFEISDKMVHLSPTFGGAFICAACNRTYVPNHRRISAR